jgi:hypothetical protein
MMMSVPEPCLGPPITAGLPDCAWMFVESSVTDPRASRTLKVTAPPFTLCGVTSSFRSPGTDQRSSEV